MHFNLLSTSTLLGAFSTDDMTIRVGIALFLVTGSSYLNTPSYWHCALVVSSSESWASQPVLCLELKKGSDGRYYRSIEKTNITIFDSVPFKGIVHLFTTSNYTVESFQALIQSHFPASDSGWRFPSAGVSQEWNCVTWILQILTHLRDEGTWAVSSRAFERMNLGEDLMEGNNMHYEGTVRVAQF
ncbi:hypothetical protein EV361DRAFT_313083 [Lentinula raphanica]|uniref:Uncharacterized protein n=1 Tax=Lentinula raphanica TaxID=153919 RepID=A0AA38UDB4_9AGAR|nr:hypothetical protein F5878DRAFT_621695 [Lentinula raphanica]KAJ3970035.1 hypothetical protein EV361DRAFT_313083 [Lentinula raphanica]